jgi:hypothetical protein
MQLGHLRSSRWVPKAVRVALALPLALALVACAGGPVALTTAGDRANVGCYLANTTGMLIPDAQAGTAIVSEDMGQTTVPVRWPPGYTGRRSGGQVEVLDSGGDVVARTGQRYTLLGGYSPDGPWEACVGGVYPPAWPTPR